MNRRNDSLFVSNNFIFINKTLIIGWYEKKIDIDYKLILPNNIMKYFTNNLRNVNDDIPEVSINY